MSTNGPVSDEPTRLAAIVTPMFAGQSGASYRLSDGATAQLLAGADAQDDCAVFRLDGSQELVLGSDYVRGAKFGLYELGYLDDYDVGYYLAMANFSDVAAMGAQPIALLSVIRYPKAMPDEDFAQVLRGINDACDQVGAPNVGGDIGTAERLILSASAVGVVEAGRSLRRDGARPGDRLCITGPTGIAAAAQRYFGRLDTAGTRMDETDEQILLNAWKRPRARVAEGRLLSTGGVVTSCQDSSDGLKAGIETIASRSGVGFVVEEEALPVVDAVAQVAKLADIDLIPLLLGDSVDFQLVFTVPAEHVPALRESFDEAGLDFHDIGVATEAPDLLLRTGDGTTRELPGAAWRHAT
ncbi:thiamine-phosphate kinase [Thermomonospora cellulosilytica]|uniref:Thiamine-monophosphate kinase n=1 Tax=Thermomonospora cellulosilytica TaxID=1411118 RepID=A0A7W3MVK0_9ACTN|nr:thiamine-phosphate kinase [Thermomonospora cellulosilytica]MBA9002709.1 thiamine-monophosphate kinase [Thermomonospora cellulosilytica]